MAKARTVTRDKLVAYLDEFLDVARIPDKSPNGLQVQGSAKVGKIAYAVDASVQTIRAAARAKADMLIVHHGLWWGAHEQIVGNMYQRIAAAIKSDLSLYAAHHPLDCHAEVGNNAELARMFDVNIEATFGNYRGVDIGVMGQLSSPESLTSFTRRINRGLSTDATTMAFGPKQVKRVGIISGGGGPFAEEASRMGCDTLLTGETYHPTFHMAQEARINVVFGGHYATETVGLHALDRHLRGVFSIPTKFIDAPTGL